MSEIIFAEGIYFGEKRENAPEFVLGSISIKPEQLTTWLKSQKANESGYVKLDILRSKKTGKPYISVNTFVPKHIDSVVKKDEISVELNDDGVVSKLSDVPFN